MKHGHYHILRYFDNCVSVELFSSSSYVFLFCPFEIILKRAPWLHQTAAGWEGSLGTKQSTPTHTLFWVVLVCVHDTCFVLSCLTPGESWCLAMSSVMLNLTTGLRRLRQFWFCIIKQYLNLWRFKHIYRSRGACTMMYASLSLYSH